LLITKTVTLQGGWSDKCTSRLTEDPSQTVIDGNRADTVVQIMDGEPRLEGLTVTGGWSPYGGGIHVENASAELYRLVVTGNAISTTTDQGTYGGGLYLENATVTLKYCDVVGNVAYAWPGNFAHGGGLCLPGYDERAYLVDTRVLSNVSTAGARLFGGGVYVAGDSSLVFMGTRSIVATNQATSGGGIYIKGTGDIANATLVSNTATYEGGAIAIDPQYSGRIYNNVIVGNEAATAGSGLFVAKAAVHVANNTFAYNNGGASAGVEVGTGGTPAVTLTNNIILGHGVGIRNLHGALSPTLVTNDFWKNDVNYVGVLTGASDLYVIPSFVDISTGDYHLTDGSLVIDAGTTLSWLTSDYDGAPRPIGAAYDIGADEWGRFAYVPLILRSSGP
jgi:hypothetical protein